MTAPLVPLRGSTGARRVHALRRVEVDLQGGRVYVGLCGVNVWRPSPADGPVECWSCLAVAAGRAVTA